MVHKNIVFVWTSRYIDSLIEDLFIDNSIDNKCSAYLKDNFRKVNEHQEYNSRLSQFIFEVL